MVLPDLLKEMRVAASDISTQDTSTDVAIEMANYMTMMKCASSDTGLLAFWLVLGRYTEIPNRYPIF